MASVMQELLVSSYLSGANAPFIEALYDRYLQDPNSIEPRWRSYFEALQQLDDGPRDVSHVAIQERFAQLAGRPRAAAVARQVTGAFDQKQLAVLQLITAYRFQGCRVASEIGRAHV